MNYRGWEGAIRILIFNRGWYALGAAAAASGFAASIFVAQPWRSILLLAVAPALFWLIASIAVSHYVYDRSPLYDFNWLAESLHEPPRRWVNIHAGLEETGPALSLPGEGLALDIFDPNEMTESSIHRARQVARRSSQSAAWRKLPLPGAYCDAVFLIFAAHELRRHEARVQLFREAARILRGGGQIVLTEHFRDWRNFLAFGPGFMHFFPEREWRAATIDAGLELSRHSTITPFVHIFVLRRIYDPHASANCGSTPAFAGRGA